MELRTLAAAVLGIGLGVLLTAFPDAAIRAQTAGRLPTDRGGEYGTDSAAPDRWRLAVRAVGVALISVGLYFGATALG